jgi:hypothetical protein
MSSKSLSETSAAAHSDLGNAQPIPQIGHFDHSLRTDKFTDQLPALGRYER